MITIIWVGFALSFFVATVMRAKKQNSPSNKILALWLFVLAIDFVLRGLEIYVYSEVLFSNSFLLFNPLFYLYTKSITKNDFKLRYIQLLNLMPYIVFEIIVQIFSNKLTLSAFFSGEVNKFLFIIFAITSIISWVYYIIKSMFYLRRYNENIKNEFSSISNRTDISWIRIIAIIYITYSIATLILGIIFYLKNYNSISLVYFISLFSLFLVYLFSYYGLLQEQIYKPKEIQTGSANPEVMGSEMEEIKNKIFVFFDKEKPYLNADFNMTVFSEKMNIPKHQLTTVLNKFIGKNFFKFVNEFRVEEVKKSLLDPKNIFSIEAIGYDCGFNSKSSFFTIFKKETGLTPLQFKKKYTDIKH